MRKLMVLSLVLTVLVIAGIGGSAMMQTTARGQGGPRGGIGSGAGAVDDMPHRTARAFAPFIRAIVTRRVNDAQRIFKLRRSVETTLETQESVRIFARFVRPDNISINLIGGRNLGENLGILLFTAATEDGPVAFKISFYGFGQDMYVARMEIVDSWEDVERLAASVDSLPNPITVSLSNVIDAGGGQ